MTPHELAARLVAHRQRGIAEPNPGLRASLARAYRDDVTVWAAWLQTNPDALQGLLHLLVTEIALERQEQGLPAPPLPDAPATVPDPAVEIRGGTPATVAGLDRLGAQLAAFPDWTISVRLDDGTTATVRPARQETHA